jgi:hypothetical protein
VSICRAAVVRAAAVGLNQITRGKFDFDVVGPYARPDVLRLLVDEEAKPRVAPNRAAQMLERRQAS